MKTYYLHKIIFTIFITVFFQEISAQQIPLYSQYFQNSFLFNPSRTGDKDHTYIYGTYRRQWTDITGSPQAFALTGDGSIKSRKLGLGGYFYIDRTDLIQRLGGNYSMA